MPLWNKPQETRLDHAINGVFDEMSNTDRDNQHFDTLTTQLTKLYKLKENDTPITVSKDTLAVIAGNIAVVLIIVGFEQKHVVTTKATSFLTKLR